MVNKIVIIVIYFISLNVESKISTPKTDESTLSNFNEIIPEHTSIELEVDFNKKKIFGTVSYKMLCKADKCCTLLLDMNKLDILGVYNLSEDNHSKHYTDIQLSYHKISQESESHLGEQLSIELPENITFNDEFFIGIDFIHQDNNPSLILIDSNQFGSTHFIYSDNSPVKSRSLFPCMDTPLVKSSYNAKILVPNGFKAVFSGILEKNKKVSMGNILKHKFYYNQVSPIPSYMVGLLVAQIEYDEINGNLVYYQLENQSKVKNSKTVELFKKVNNYLNEIQTLFKNLNQNFKPVSFIIMPRMFHHKSFSFKNLILLNINLLDDLEHFIIDVSNEVVQSAFSSILNHSCWRHAALSSGLTKFIERLLIRSIEGKDVSELHKNLGEIELYDTIEEYENDHRTSMYPELRHLKPKEFVTPVSKEKGFTFFNFLNQGIGKENLIEIIELMGQYFTKEGMNYGDFGMNYIDRVRKLLRFRHHEVINQIDWDLWLLNNGEPPFNMLYDSPIVEHVSELVNNVVHDIGVDEVKEKYNSLTSIAKTTFLKRLNKLNVNDDNNSDLEGNKNKNHNRQLFENSKIHGRRNLDRSHSRMLQSRVLKNLVNSLEVIQSISDKDSKYLNTNEADKYNFVERIEFIVLGLKAKEESFIKLAKKALNNTFEMTAIKKLFSALKEYDKNIALKYLDKFSIIYNNELKEELKKILNS